MKGTDTGEAQLASGESDGYSKPVRMPLHWQRRGQLCLLSHSSHAVHHWTAPIIASGIPPDRFGRMGQIAQPRVSGNLHDFLQVAMALIEPISLSGAIRPGASAASGWGVQPQRFPSERRVHA